MLLTPRFWSGYVRGVRRFWLLAAVVAAVVIWRVGETHKAACLQAGKVNCSVLPWSGSSPGSGATSAGGTLQGVSSSAHGVGGSVGGSISGSGHSVP